MRSVRPERKHVHLPNRRRGAAFLIGSLLPADFNQAALEKLEALAAHPNRMNLFLITPMHLRSTPVQRSIASLTISALFRRWSLMIRASFFPSRRSSASIICSCSSAA